MAKDLEKKQRVNMIGRRLSQIRVDKGLSQYDLAAGSKCTQGLISQYESGVSEPPLATLIRLCDAMGCSVDYILGRDMEYGDSLRGRLLKAFESLNATNQAFFVHILESSVEQLKEFI